MKRELKLRDMLGRRLSEQLRVLWADRGCHVPQLQSLSYACGFGRRSGLILESEDLDYVRNSPETHVHISVSE